MPDIPEAWIGEEVTVFYSPLKSDRMTGTLESVEDRGIVLRNVEGTKDEAVYWYPITSVMSVRFPKVPPSRTKVHKKPRGF
jgi:hypothetical protein